MLGAGWHEPPWSNQDVSWPERPGRPSRPQLCDPRDMPRRNAAALEGRIALLHALAHIELNAIDLAIDIIGRFYDENMPQSFAKDWMSVAMDEAKHFLMLNKRLKELDSHYGALNAHDGLWQSAVNTSHDITARLAIVPLVLEARGLDVTPDIISKLEDSGDTTSSNLLSIIYEDEKEHVRLGMKWFTYFCDKQGISTERKYQALIKAHFKKGLKAPFNDHARQQAGMPVAFYRTI